MKPGDLVFYSGTYYNTKLRAQKHDMVHVEIFTGGETGEQSIGARWQRGVVQYFDSYHFKSTSYHSIVCHYRSIDTWLEGICKPYCKQHNWSSANLQWAPGKKSIFSIDDDYDEADLNAPDVDDGMQCDEGQIENTSTAAPKKPAVVNTKCFVGQGNNERLVKESLTNLGFKLLPRGMLFSDDYRFKWTQTSMEVNYMKFKEGVHIANHISNSNKVFTSKISLIETIEELKLNLQTGILKSDMIKSVADFVPETYRLDVVSDLHQFLSSKTQGLWLEKKSQSNQGRGITLISDIDEYRDKIMTNDDEYMGKGSDYYVKDSTDMLLEKLEQL